MKLREEYVAISDKEEVKLNKRVISDDAFAVCDFIERLINKLEQARINSLR